MPQHGRQLGVLFLDDTVAKAHMKHLMGRYLPAGPAASRPAKGRRKGEAYYATDTHVLSVWDGTAWIAGGVGPVGPAGATGPPGPIGIGLDGADGADGSPVPGPQGIPGTPGATGAPGVGVEGRMGMPGFDGADGMDGFPTPGPSGAEGATGAAGVGMLGPPGLDGADGLDGFPIPGPAGADGAVGAEGAAGADGADGVVGAMGPPGMDGDGIVDYGLLGVPSSLLHLRYTNTEAVAAVEAEGSLNLYQEVGIGANDTRNGILNLYGAGAGVAEGGSLWLYLSADHDASFNFYELVIEEDDLEVQHNGGADFRFKADRSIEVTTGPLKVDHLAEYTTGGGGHGVDIDGVLLKDDAVETDAIRGLRTTTGPTSLEMGAVADGEFLHRVGSTLVGGTPAGGVDIVTVWAFGD